jgi:hypothetical protein
MKLQVSTLSIADLVALPLLSRNNQGSDHLIRNSLYLQLLMSALGRSQA